MRKLDPQERAELEALARHLHALTEARKNARDAFLNAAHSATCRGVSVRELAFVSCKAQDLSPADGGIVEQRLKVQLHDHRTRTERAPCSPRSARRRMPRLSKQS